MRLTCPNCGAQYEVPQEVIPETGRDVQCSDCGTTWFQHHPDHPGAEDIAADTVPEPASDDHAASGDTPTNDEPREAGTEHGADYTSEEDPGGFHADEAPPELDQEAEPEVQTTEPEPHEPDLPEQAKETELADPGSESLQQESSEQRDALPEAWPEAHEPEPEPEPDIDPDIEPEFSAEDQQEQEIQEPVRQRLDEDVAAVLRQEAELEKQAREQETRAGLETQPELGLPEQDSSALKRSEEAKARMARLRGEDTVPDATSAAVTAAVAAHNAKQTDDLDIDPSSRSNLLPDIDEINSSLESQTSREPTEEKTETAETTPAKSGFRTGFRVAILVALVALLVYLFAPRLMSAVPALEAPLSAYVDVVNGMRAKLAGLVESIAFSIDESSTTE